jgi:hypothetical protein
MKYVYKRYYKDMKLFRKILKITSQKNDIITVIDICTGEELKIFEYNVYDYNFLSTAGRYYWLKSTKEYMSKYEKEEYNEILEQFGKIIPEQFI